VRKLVGEREVRDSGLSTGTKKTGQITSRRFRSRTVPEPAQSRGCFIRCGRTSEPTFCFSSSTEMGIKLADGPIGRAVSSREKHVSERVTGSRRGWSPDALQGVFARSFRVFELAGREIGRTPQEAGTDFSQEVAGLTNGLGDFFGGGSGPRSRFSSSHRFFGRRRRNRPQRDTSVGEFWGRFGDTVR